MRIGVLIIVAAALAVLAGSWVWLGERQGRSGDAGERLFPGLERKLNTIGRIRVEHAGSTYDVIKRGDQWQLPDKGGYPVLFGRVKPLLLGIAQLEQVEPQTDKPEHYARLGVGEPAADSDNWRISLYAGADTPVASLIVGRLRIGLIAGGKDGIYGRIDGQSRAWLLAGNLALPQTQVDWVDRQVIHIKPKAVKRVTIRHPDGDLLVLERPRRGAPEFIIVNLPEGTVPKEGVDLNPLARSLAGLKMEDVLVRSQAGLKEEAAVSAVFDTWDGLEVTAHTVQRDGRILVWFDVGAAALDAGDMAGVRTVATDHADLRERLAGWVFQIPQAPGQRLRKRVEELVQKGG